QINNTGLMGLITRHRLNEIQSSEHLPSNPAHCWPYTQIERFSKSFISDSLSLCKSQNINLNVAPEHINRIQGGTLPILECVPSQFYRNNRSPLMRNNLLFMDQISCSNRLYSWSKYLSLYKLKSRRVPLPWFTLLHQEILKLNPTWTAPMECSSL